MQAGNDKYDLAKAEQIAKEKAKAHIKFGEASKLVEKRKAGDLEATADEPDSSDSDSSSDSSADTPEPIVKAPAPKKKKQKQGKSESKPSSGTSTPVSTSKMSETRSKRANKRIRRKGKIEKSSKIEEG